MLSYFRRSWEESWGKKSVSIFFSFWRLFLCLSKIFLIASTEPLVVYLFLILLLLLSWATATTKTSVHYLLSPASPCPEGLSINNLHSVLLTLLPSHLLVDLNLRWFCSGKNSAFWNFLPASLPHPSQALLCLQEFPIRQFCLAPLSVPALPHRVAMLYNSRRHHSLVLYGIWNGMSWDIATLWHQVVTRVICHLLAQKKYQPRDFHYPGH